MDGVNKYVQIQISGIKNGTLFSDRKYIANEQFIVEDDDTNVYITKEGFYTIDYQNIKIPQIICVQKFRKSILSINISENIDISDLKTANNIIIIDTENNYYLCQIIDYSFEDVDVTRFKRCTINFKILKKFIGNGTNKNEITNTNYITDYASSDFVLNKISSGRVMFRLYNYEEITGDSQIISETGQLFYTKLYPKLGRSEIVINKEILTNGDEVVNKILSFATVTGKFFLSESQFNTLKKYIDICFYKNLSNQNFGNYIAYGIYKYEGIKSATFKYNENIEIENLGLFDVDITVYYEKLNYSPQRNNTGSFGEAVDENPDTPIS